jgi:hypothetical protein
MIVDGRTAKERRTGWSVDCNDYEYECEAIWRSSLWLCLDTAGLFWIGTGCVPQFLARVCEYV